jgi:hypothetical protein
MIGVRAGRWALVVAIGLAGGVTVRAQTASGGTPGASEPATQAPAPPPAFSRWVDIDTASLQARYRYLETSQHVVTTRQVQDHVSLKARLKLDAKGRYSVTGMAGTGPTLTAAWNDTGIGTGDLVHAFAVKQLFLAAAPVVGLELSYGGLVPVRGESTEITSYDNDAYLVGQRVSVKRPEALFVDEISVTAAFLGDTGTPNVFRRFDRLDEVNYVQALASKRLAPWLRASADVTRVSSVSTVRAAAAITLSRGKPVDTLRYEQYARAGGNPAFGFAVTGEKKALPRLTVSLGWADIDLRYGGLNGDRYNRGRRVFGAGTVRLWPELSLLVFGTHSFDDEVTLPNHHRFDVILAYNALATLKRAGLTR